MSKLTKRVASFLTVLAITVTFNSAAFAIDAPVLITSTSGLSLSLSWTAIPGATGYTLHYAPSPYTGSDSIVQASMGTKTNASYRLLNGASYYVAIKANNTSELSGYSNIEMFIIGTIPPYSGYLCDTYNHPSTCNWCSSEGYYWWSDNTCKYVDEPPPFNYTLLRDHEYKQYQTANTCNSAGGYWRYLSLPSLHYRKNYCLMYEPPIHLLCTQC